MTEDDIRILIIEDSDTKFYRLNALIEETIGSRTAVIRAPTINEAEKHIENNDWHIILLDISMDINSSKKGPKLGGHATLGGLSIATKMYLLGREAPTIIVTAFDSFETFDGGKREYSIGLGEIESRAKALLGDSLIGCIRYGGSNWEPQLKDLLRSAAK